MTERKFDKLVECYLDRHTRHEGDTYLHECGEKLKVADLRVQVELPDGEVISRGTIRTTQCPKCDARLVRDGVYKKPLRLKATKSQQREARFSRDSLPDRLPRVNGHAHL